MAKRSKLEIIKDILKIIQENHSPIKLTPLLRKSNLSSKRFYSYLNELKNKEFIKKIKTNISLTIKGEKYLEKYQNIIDFINDFGLQ